MTREEAVFFQFFPMWLVILTVLAVAARVFYKAPLRNGLLLAFVTAITTAFATSQFPALWRLLLLGSSPSSMSPEVIELNQQVAVCFLAGVSVIASGALYELLSDALTRTLSLVTHSKVSEHVAIVGGSGVVSARQDTLQDDEDSVE